jgi:Uma2 family endonuclease
MSRPQPQEPYYTREEFRQWCAAQNGRRYERVDGRIVAMAPERVGRARVKGNVFVALRRAILAAGIPCEAIPDGVTVETGDNDYEPDALVNCGPPMDNDATSATNPVIIVEVLSPSTAGTDTGGKLAGYFEVPSVAHYLIVHPTKRTVIHHRRDESGSIVTKIMASGEIKLDPPGLSIMVEEFYAAG